MCQLCHDNGSELLCLSESVSDVTLPRLKAFIPQLLSRLHIEALLHGNITKQVRFDVDGRCFKVDFGACEGEEGK